MNKIFKVAAAAAIIGASATSFSFAEDWDMPTPYPDKTFHTVNIQQFADEVREATGGQLNIKLHTAGSLIKHGEIKNSVRNKIVPAGEFFLSLLANEDPAFGIDSLPLKKILISQSKVVEPSLSGKPFTLPVDLSSVKPLG